MLTTWIIHKRETIDVHNHRGKIWLIFLLDWAWCGLELLYATFLIQIHASLLVNFQIEKNQIYLSNLLWRPPQGGRSSGFLNYNYICLNIIYLQKEATYVCVCIISEIVNSFEYIFQQLFFCDCILIWQWGTLGGQ